MRRPSDDPMNTSLKRNLVCLSSEYWKDARLYNVLLRGPGLTPADGLTVAVGKLLFEENDDISRNVCSR
jgi:hypothetical protein